MQKNTDTIVARATPLGKGSIGVIRISGNCSINVIKEILHISYMKPRYAYYLPFYYKNKVIDKGIALWFPKPNSFTGEDVFELQCHGGTVILDLLIRYIMTFPGIRIAKPGEFTERAFLNKKIDLTQAEAISDLILADSKTAVFSAMNLLNGKFSFLLNKFTKTIINLRTDIEFFIEFEENDIKLYKVDILIKLKKILNDLSKIIKHVDNGINIREGIKIIFIGPPNSGKSSLMNLLSERDVSIITDIPGTTRDILYEKIYINSIPIQIIDTAGIRNTKNKIENIGIKKTINEINRTNYIFLIVNDNISNNNLSKIINNYLSNFKKKIPIIIIKNKIDLTHNHSEIVTNNEFVTIKLSVKTKKGISLLINYIKNNITNIHNTEDMFTSRTRHIDILKTVFKYIKTGQLIFSSIDSPIELLSENLKLAQIELDNITGKFTSKKLLESIFSKFCIGK
ncbi:tRNA uridine-5-carboxymethylaminomethyl(34) synthesis GTPase MnmE [Enterobacteriaceae endosymbiont of Plateumaris consimilis]|uniref:tRNA uridine-5-carboxymethylaminomethyl(34) synthesis GTPase MnmE n=1 Tax=Enterobacteriaceae endosymbiont of Plateumaris consimilis TaxID=2675794 RepID=UPI00144A265D|nr:tRNA uridine-5-carboxymethylaminomethyl(34) synthesis GTPase MnmE [Enterobacteriaceae endosymbiont of Plateumaris consimilis]QJC28829.1 tRNA uridine-5-carboxymethylaminomethyl(34) synthesis GTPase MnmE [Enterobacteriaceae endosymbiont of Plateumaris consimilis]